MRDIPMRGAHSFILLLSCLLLNSGASADTALQLQQILDRAKTMQLAEHESWLSLLHFKRESILRRFISQADDERFFIDENGKTDAAAELVADIRAFMQPQQNNHAQCRFPARWWWLKQQLELGDGYDVSCPKLDAFMQRISHDRLYMVFPSMYLNNPGSTFGHTFLRFDDEDGSILLSQTLNYAARVDQSDDLFSYISKGLFGGYTGFFRARQYFETVQEYSNIENRDIWEYRLDFSKQEIQQLVRHVWEVKGIDFDYYFFRENCAYRLLALLDVIRPGMQLTAEDAFPLYAIPVDTVRALQQQALILTKTFRPSLATQINDYFDAEPAFETDSMLSIVDSHSDTSAAISSQISGLTSDAEKHRVLKQSYNLLQFRGESTTPKARQVLQLLSELSGPADKPDDYAEEKIRYSPEVGHDSIRAAVGYGEQNSLSYIDLRLRPAFHDLLDAGRGYVEGAAINVFDARLKYFTSDQAATGGLRLESLSLFNVTSLSPLSRWQSPVSWLFDFRFDRVQLDSSRSVRNFISRGGVGFSVRHQGITPYALLMGEWHLASAYQKGYSILLGAQAGLLVSAGPSRLKLSLEQDYAVSGFELNKTTRLFEWQYNFQVDHAVRLRYQQLRYDFYDDEDWSIDYRYYF